MTIVAGSCYLHNPGITAPPAALNFPTAVALSRDDGGAPRYLYVANSNFDLRYNSGSMQSYDLAALDVVMARSHCRTYGSLVLDKNGAPIDAGTIEFPDNTDYSSYRPAMDGGTMDAGMMVSADGGVAAPVDAGVTSFDGGGPIVVSGNYTITSNYGNARGFLCDGDDPPDDVDAGIAYSGCCLDTQVKLDEIRKSFMRLDSFAVGVVVAPQNDRIYVPVASKNRLVYFDVNDGNLDCGEGVTYCQRGPGLHSADNVPDDSFPGAVSEIAQGTMDQLLPPDVRKDYDVDTNSVYLATTHDLGAVGLFIVPYTGPADPVTGLRPNGVPILNATVHGLGQRPRSIWSEPRSDLLYITSAGEGYISRVGVRINDAAYDGREGPREVLFEGTRIIVPGVSQSGDLRDLAVDPVDPSKLYVLIRGTQESVAFLQVDSTQEGLNARTLDEVRIGAGPSKMNLIQQDGKTFLVVTCYDEKSLYMIDAETHLLAGVVRSFSGPFTMVYDASRKLLHVADFQASIMRVVDLSGLTDKNQPPPRIVATIGSPQFEGSIQ